MREETIADNSHSRPARSTGLGALFPQFNIEDVDDDLVAQVIEQAALGPMEWNLQSRSWILIRSREAKRQLEGATSVRLPLASAPVILVCLADTLAWKAAPQYLQQLVAKHEISEDVRHDTLRQVREYYSASPEIARRTAFANACAVVHNLLQKAREANLSTFWISEFDEVKIKNQFHIPDQFVVAAIIPLGRSASVSSPPSSKNVFPTVVYKEKFGESSHP